MKWHENRILAWVALALCAALSVFGLGGMYLSRTRNRAMAVFMDGAGTSQSSRQSVDAWLTHAGESARIMASEAEIHLGITQLTQEAASEAAVLIDGRGTLAARQDAYDKLKAHVEQLYSDLYAAVSENESKNFKLAYADFWGDDDLIRRDAYPALAHSYNRLITGFPAGIVAMLTGNGTLATFGG